MTFVGRTGLVNGTCWDTGTEREELTKVFRGHLVCGGLYWLAVYCILLIVISG